MLFTAPVFLFFFLPLTFFIHLFLPMRWKNLCLLLASVFFYYYGEQFLFVWLLVSIAANQLFAMAIHFLGRKRQAPGARRLLLAACITFNLGLLGYFKYANFFVIEILQADPAGWASVALPIGISFYTFQCLSYVLDVYRDDCPPTGSVIDFGAYIASFPQLIAGPIVRYKDVAEALVHREISVADVYEGARRFCIGLGKKMLLANPAGYIADQVFAMPVQCIDAAHAWLGTLAYCLQIYYDFSGYSDMAIGLGRMLGFRFPENFNYPYIARSIQEFWRRWHMTLTRWFRDYLYIPLGGNRRGALRTALNKWLIFLLCGLWHGASWSFIVWGIFHGCFIILESTPFGALLEKARPVFSHAYTLLVLAISFIIFRADNIHDAWQIIISAFGLGSPEPYALSISRFWRGDLILPVCAGLAGAMPLAPWLRRRVISLAHGGMIWELGTGVWLLLTLIVSACFSVATTFNPFLYFRF